MNHKFKVAVLAEFVSAKDNSTGYYWQSIIKWISEDFGKTLVVCPKNANLMRDEAISYQMFSSISFSKNSVFGRVTGQLSQVLGFITKGLLNVKPGMVVITGTNPIILLFFMPFFRAISRTKWILLVHDLYPDNVALSGLMNKKSVMFKVLDWIFSRVYRAADAVIVIGRDMEEMLYKKGVCPSKIKYQPNWVNAGDVIPADKGMSPLIRNLGWSSNVVFQYFGNMGRVQGIKSLLKAIGKVNSGNARFLFCGSGVYADSVKDFCLKNPHCHFIPDSAFERNIILSSCDISIVHLMPGMFGLGVPSKAYFSLAANRPILVAGDGGSELDLLIQEKSVGWFLSSSNIDEMARKIDQISDSGISPEIKPYDVYEDSYDGRTARQTVRSLITSLRI